MTRHFPGIFFGTVAILFVMTLVHCWGSKRSTMYPFSAWARMNSSITRALSWADGEFLHTGLDGGVPLRPILKPCLMPSVTICMGILPTWVGG